MSLISNIAMISTMKQMLRWVWAGDLVRYETGLGIYFMLEVQLTSGCSFRLVKEWTHVIWVTHKELKLTSYSMYREGHSKPVTIERGNLSKYTKAFLFFSLTRVWQRACFHGRLLLMIFPGHNMLLFFLTLQV